MGEYVSMRSYYINNADISFLTTELKNFINSSSDSNIKSKYTSFLSRFNNWPTTISSIDTNQIIDTSSTEWENFQINHLDKLKEKLVSQLPTIKVENKTHTFIKNVGIYPLKNTVALFPDHVARTRLLIGIRHYKHYVTASTGYIVRRFKYLCHIPLSDDTVAYFNEDRDEFLKLHNSLDLSGSIVLIHNTLFLAKDYDNILEFPEVMSETLLNQQVVQHTQTFAIDSYIKAFETLNTCSFNLYNSNILNIQYRHDKKYWPIMVM